MLDTRELGRRPGSQREVTLTVPAPADLGIEVLHVPESSPVDLDLRLEAVMEGLLTEMAFRMHPLPPDFRERRRSRFANSKRQFGLSNIR